MTDKTEKGPFVVAFDTICDGWQSAVDEAGNPVVYATREEAEREIAQDLEARRQSYADDGFMDDDYTETESEDFVVPLDEFQQGRKAIWYPSQK